MPAAIAHRFVPKAAPPRLPHSTARNAMMTCAQTRRRRSASEIPPLATRIVTGGTSEPWRSRKDFDLSGHILNPILGAYEHQIQDREW